MSGLFRKCDIEFVAGLLGVTRSPTMHDADWHTFVGAILARRLRIVPANAQRALIAWDSSDASEGIIGEDTGFLAGYAARDAEVNP